MRPVLRPQESELFVEKVPVSGQCPECGSSNIKAYPVLSEGGWWKVQKCQDCLCSVERERWGLFGSMTSLTDSM